MDNRIDAAGAVGSERTAANLAKILDMGDKKVSVRALQQWLVQQMNAKKIVIKDNVESFNEEFKSFVSANGR